MKIDKFYLSLAGVHRVCAELLQRGLFAQMTYGNSKGADIHVFSVNRRVVVVEVKSSNSQRFVTGFYQKYRTIDAPHPDFWVLYRPRSDAHDEQFFILTHEEMAEAQAKGNFGEESLPYLERVARVAKGVDNVNVKNVTQHEDAWDKIVCHCAEATTVK